MMSLNKQLESVAKKIGAKFTYKGQPIAPMEVFSDTGLLPGLTKRANQLAQLCFGYGLGATYENTEQALLGSRVIFDETTPNSLRLLCITDTLYEIIKMSPSKFAVSLDELVYD